MTVPRAQMATHRGHVFFWKFSADQLLALNWSQTHVYVFTHVVMDLWISFSMVWIPLSEVNLKCINGNFVLSSGLSGRLLLYRTRNQKAKFIPCRGCALKAEKFTQQIWWYNFKILLFSHSLCLRLSRKVVGKNVHGITPTENMRIINTLFLTLKLSNLFLLFSLSTCKHTSMAFRAIWRTVNFKPSAIGHSVLLRALSPTTFL